MRPSEAWGLLREAVNAWIEDHVPSMGAALAYYTVFSIAPMLLIAIAVAGLVFGVDAARGEIVAQLRGLMGEEGARAIEALVKSAAKPVEGLTATVVAALMLLVGATTVFVELQSALDRIWRAPVQRHEGILALLRSRLLSFGMVMGVGFLLTVSLVLSAAVAVLGKFWGAHLGGWLLVAEALNFVVGLALVTLMFGLIYKIMPRVPVRWRDVWIGAAFTAVLFVIGKALIGLYIGRSGIASGFGAAGSLVVLLLWVYYSAQIFLLGAEFTRMVARRRAHLAIRREPAQSGMRASSS
ncbi:YihY/virulence factor BrkB family protein [Aquincola sp. S2]|uniref:YihY/virulence factor BrkB family protein n=1 Tax=Pseudaquabacterium terrae TaxID=2732868 RepID=A0ABX2EHU4_9BURK|nr:YihY/virulence factor BrkB family protein [Aquabacterium terrae]NRF68195.1 YihY/virulence factor BrkB family protein [Aquabacterium terrae]